MLNYMVERREVGLDAVFHALGHVTRRRMLRALAEGECTVGQLAEPFRMSLAAASKHVKALEVAGLIRREVRGRTHHCRLEAGPLSAANEWLRFYEQFWTARLDRLEDLLTQNTRRDAGARSTAGAESHEPSTSIARRGARKIPRKDRKKNQR